ncbi:MAG: calcium/sodium antiporter [Blautia sp.]|nr:calcium/sodium antiporter [Blautia sp.]
MIVPVLLFILGLVLLIKGGDWFVDGASAIAHRYHVPELIIGATIVSIGTTLPEVLVSATSAVSHHGEIAYGNAIGSIICNTALISAITMAVRPGIVAASELILPVIFYFLAAIFYAGNAYLTGYFSRPIGLVLLGIFLIYMILTLRRGFASQSAPSKEEVLEKAEEITMSLGKAVALLVIGAALIAVGANLLVNNGTKIAAWMGVPESVIALTFVALGTSLPELVTAVTSLIKGHSALSVGNVIGANLFNLVLVCGVSVTLSPFSIPTEKLLFGRNASLVLDIPLTFIVMLIMTVPALWKGKLYRLQGISLLAIYAAFCAFQFMA